MTDAGLDKIILKAVKSGLVTLGDLNQAVGIHGAASACDGCTWGDEMKYIAKSLQRLKKAGKIKHAAGRGWSVCK
jgi:bacterioferritin-associated ferredoxin